MRTLTCMLITECAPSSVHPAADATSAAMQAEKLAEFSHTALGGVASLAHLANLEVRDKDVKDTVGALVKCAASFLLCLSMTMTMSMTMSSCEQLMLSQCYSPPLGTGRQIHMRHIPL